MTPPFSRVKPPSLNALRAFEAAARHQSFSRAAEELNVSAGAVAQQVKQLEDWVGSPLFQRSAQGIKLSKSAARMLPVLSKAFDQLSEAVTELRHIGAPREISIAALPSIALLWLSPRLPRLSALFPDRTLSIATLEYPPNFRRDDFDMAFFYLEDLASSSGELVIPLGKDELLPVCSPALVSRQPLETENDLCSQKLLHDAMWRNHWQLWLDHAGFTSVDASAGSVFSIFSLAMQAAIDGAGVLVGRSSLVTQALHGGQLVEPFPLRRPAPDELCLLLPQDSPLAARRADLLECLRT
jgi:LysR family glycine cleavage system transcriptional activator